MCIYFWKGWRRPPPGCLVSRVAICRLPPPPEPLHYACGGECAGLRLGQCLLTKCAAVIQLCAETGRSKGLLRSGPGTHGTIKGRQKLHLVTQTGLSGPSMEGEAGRIALLFPEVSSSEKESGNQSQAAGSQAATVNPPLTELSKQGCAGGVLGGHLPKGLDGRPYI